MYFKLIDIINSISCFQLAIFSFFLIHKGRKSISNIILSAFFLVQFVVILNVLLISVFEKNTSFHIQIAYTYYPFEYLWGPLIYFYVVSQVKQGFRFKSRDLVHLIPFFIAALFIIMGYYIQDDDVRYQIIVDGSINKWFSFIYFPYFLLLFAYNFSALSLLNEYQQNLKDYYSFEIKQNMVWLKFVLYGYIIACIVSALNSIAGKYIPVAIEFKTDFLFATFLLFFNILFYRAMIQPFLLIQAYERPKYSGSSINESDMCKYSQSIKDVLITKKLYLNPSLTLQGLSESAGVSERIISQVINQYSNQNFFSFINAYRIEEAKILLNSLDQNKTTMLGISIDVGFNSKSAFYDAFKKQTGMTPTEFRKMKF